MFASISLPLTWRVACWTRSQDGAEGSLCTQISMPIREFATVKLVLHTCFAVVKYCDSNCWKFLYLLIVSKGWDTWPCLQPRFIRKCKLGTISPTTRTFKTVGGLQEYRLVSWQESTHKFEGKPPEWVALMGSRLVSRRGSTTTLVKEKETMKNITIATIWYRPNAYIPSLAQN